MDQDVSQVHELAFWNLFSVVGYLAQPWCKWEGLGPASTWYAKLCWLSKGGLTLSEDWMRSGGLTPSADWMRGGMLGVRGWERELWMVCKNFFKNVK